MSRHPASTASAVFARFVASHPTRDRTALEALCASHVELAAELRSLHAAYELAAKVLDDSTHTASATEHAAQTAPTNVTILEEIGRGGMGVVYRAVDAAFGRELALKRVLPGASASRFLRECRITAHLDHPAIVPVHARGVDAAGNPWFTMKLVRGENLHRVIQRLRAGEPGWTLMRVIGVLVRVCEAVDYAHARGIVHRDLKPSNVMVGEFGEVHVLDWGLAAERDDGGADQESASPTVEADARMTQDGDVLGTLCYMAPEQARGEAHRADPRTDVYGLGTMLYETLRGSPPHSEHPPGTDLLERVRRGPAPLPADAGTPAPLAAVCRRAMAVAPSERYPSATALGADLRAWSEGRVVAAFEGGPWAEARRWVGRHRALAALVAVLVVALPVIALLGAHAVASAADVRRARAADVQARVRQLIAAGFVELNTGREGSVRAGAAFASALDLEPSSPEAAIGRALARRELGDAAAAAAELSAWRARYPRPELARLPEFLQSLAGTGDGGESSAWVPTAGTHVLDIYLEGSRLLRQRTLESVQRAADLFEQGIRCAREPVFLLHDGLLSARTWLRVEHAVLQVDAALAGLWPDDAACLVARANANYGIARFRDSLRLAQDATARRPDWALTHQYVALAAVEANEPQLGLQAIQSMEGIAPLTIRSLAIKANLLRLAGDNDAAENTMRTALARDESEASTWFHWNVMLMGLGRNEDALVAADRALALWKQPHADVSFDYRGMRPRALANRGICLARLGRLEEAQAALEEATAGELANATIWTSLGAVRAMRGDKQGARAAHEQAVLREPRHPQALNNLGDVLMDTGRGEEALDLLRRAVRAAPRYAIAWRNLGRAEAMNANGPAARAAFARACELAPTDGNAAWRLADLLVRTGCYDEALAVVARYPSATGDDRKVLEQKAQWATTAKELLASTAAARLSPAEVVHLASEQAELRRHHLAATLFRWGFAAAPAAVPAQALTAATCAITAARYADASEAQALYRDAIAWLRQRLAGDPPRDEVLGWYDKLPLGEDADKTVPDAARAEWRQFAHEVAVRIAK